MPALSSDRASVPPGGGASSPAPAAPATHDRRAASAGNAAGSWLKALTDPVRPARRTREGADAEGGGDLAIVRLDAYRCCLGEALLVADGSGWELVITTSTASRADLIDAQVVKESRDALGRLSTPQRRT